MMSRETLLTFVIPISLAVLSWVAAFLIRRRSSQLDRELAARQQAIEQILSGSVDFENQMIWITLRGGLRQGTSLSQYEWLQQANDPKRYRYRLDNSSIHWDELGKKIDLADLLGNSRETYPFLTSK